MSKCENGNCPNTARIGEPYCSLCKGAIQQHYSRKQMLSEIRTDLASLDTGKWRMYHLREAVLREAILKLTQLIEDLHDLG